MLTEALSRHAPKCNGQRLAYWSALRKKTGMHPERSESTMDLRHAAAPGGSRQKTECCLSRSECHPARVRALV
eukprot:3870556-Prymnesium_polylepis.1